MADLSDLEVELTIQERDISKISKGQKCHIRAEAFPDRTYHGEVSRLMPTSRPVERRHSGSRKDPSATRRRRRLFEARNGRFSVVLEEVTNGHLSLREQVVGAVEWEDREVKKWCVSRTPKALEEETNRQNSEK